MPWPDYDELPFRERPDLTPYLVHLTKNTESVDEFSALDNLASILRLGKIAASEKSNGFIKGPHGATCFMDVPFIALKHILTAKNSDRKKPRYEAFGVVVSKEFAYKRRCRPVLYLSDAETTALGIPRGELWRVVRFESKDEGWISWIHEREWRCKGDFHIPTNPIVLVRNTNDVQRLDKMMRAAKKPWKAKPRSIIPLVLRQPSTDG